MAHHRVGGAESIGAGYPKVRIYDAGADSGMDRYTAVVVDPEWQTSVHPGNVPFLGFGPGIDQFGEGKEGPAFGKRIAFASLPENMQRVVLRRLAPEPQGPHAARRVSARDSFTPGLSGSHVGQRVEILKVEGGGPNSYFKPGQFGYVVGQNTSGGMQFMDVRRESAPGEIALLIAKTREMRGGALWFSLDGVRFTGRNRTHTAREAGGRERHYSMSYGELPSFEKFEHDVHTRVDPDYDDGRVYWPPGTLYPMELVSAHEIELAETFGLEEFEAERQITGRNTRVRGFKDNERAIYEFLEFLVDRFNNGDEEAGDLASSIMMTLGYEWI